MRKRLVPIVVCVVIAGLLLAPVAEAGKKKKKKPKASPTRIERKVEFDYVCPCAGVIQLGSLTGGNPNFGGGPLPLGVDDLWVTGVADDTSGRAVAVSINQDTNGDGFNDDVGAFCGETEAPIQLAEERAVRIFIGDQSVCPGPALGGTVTFTFSNLP